MTNPSLSDQRPLLVLAGADSVPGGAIARRVAEGGWRLALLGSGMPTLEQLADELAAAHGHGVAAPLACDLDDAVAIESTFTVIREQIGGVDGMVILAGSQIEACAREAGMHAGTIVLVTPRPGPDPSFAGMAAEWEARGVRLRHVAGGDEAGPEAIAEACWNHVHQP